MLGLLIALLQPAPPAPPALQPASRPAKSAQQPASSASQPVKLPEMPVQMRIGQRAVAPTVLTAADQLSKAVDTRVRFEGEAANAKLAAIVVHPAFAIYLMDKPSWTDAEHGRRVRITGVLRRSDAFKSRKTPDGFVTQGTAGAVYLVRAAQVEFID